MESIKKFASSYPVRIIDGSDKEHYQTQLDEVVKKYSDEIQISVEHLGYNIHHGPGMDYAISNSKCDYVLILDSDLVLLKDIHQILEESINIKKMISGFSSYVNKDGFDVHTPDILYVHPRFMIVNVKKYIDLKISKNVKYIKHGAPCIQTMKYIHDNHLEDEMLYSLNP